MCVKCGQCQNFDRHPKFTRFEKARIVGARALQTSMGAPILVDVSEGFSSPMDIALKELDVGILPITIRRTLPDGTYQDILSLLNGFLKRNDCFLAFFSLRRREPADSI